VRLSAASEPMLARPSPLPSGPAWSFELKWDGFRALVSTEKGCESGATRLEHDTRPARAAKAPEGLVLDGELVAWKGREPSFPNLRRRMLNNDLGVAVTFVAFDLRGLDGTDLTARPYEERRDLLVNLGLDGRGWATSESFEDGEALFSSVCDHGLEGVVAKKRSSRYRPGQRGWMKTKNPNYWRRESEIEGCADPPSAD
jgi:bifunctional non-homologous end joining protein LigD